MSHLIYENKRNKGEKVEIMVKCKVFLQHDKETALVPGGSQLWDEDWETQMAVYGLV